MGFRILFQLTKVAVSLKNGSNSAFLFGKKTDLKTEQH